MSHKEANEPKLEELPRGPVDQEGVPNTAREARHMMDAAHVPVLVQNGPLKARPQNPTDQATGLPKISYSSEVEQRYQPDGGRPETMQHLAPKFEECSKKADRDSNPSVEKYLRRASIHMLAQSSEDVDQHRDTVSSPARAHRSAIHLFGMSGPAWGAGGVYKELPVPPRIHSRLGRSRLDVEQAYTTPFQSVLLKPRTQHDSKMLSKYHVSAINELQKTKSLLKDKDHEISSLAAQIFELRQGYCEQRAVLSSVLQELKSCQSQLDNVQRFISTADPYADHDIIQKLHELNAEVYQTSMTMADRVAEGFMCERVMDTETKAPNSLQESVPEVVGQVIAKYMASVKEEEDFALPLQIGFQGYLVDLLCWIVSSWSDDKELNTLVAETHQRLREAETQSICRRWRSLTRTYLFPNSTSNPKSLMQLTITGLSNIIGAAGFVALKSDIESELSAEFGNKIASIISHAGKFGNMIADMVSGDFEVFSARPGEEFERERMMDMNDSEGVGVPRGTEAAQTVLCGTRVGLRKQTEKGMMTLTKAEVMLTSFLE